MSAIHLLTRAIEYDMGGRRMEALKLYEDGIAELLKMCKDETDPVRKKHFQTKIVEYMKRAEEVKELVKKLSMMGKLVTKIHIMENATGHDYKSLFGKYMDNYVKEILVDEPYLRDFYQLNNFVMFCELAVASCRDLKYIKVTTVKDTNQRSQQINCLTNLTKNLNGRNITFHIEFSDHLHDRQILLSNGYTIKIGRGLNYFKGVEKFSLGTFNFMFRECRETNVDIYFCPENKK